MRTPPGRLRIAVAAAVLVGIAVPGTLAARAATGGEAAEATPFSPTGLYSNGAYLPNGRLVSPAGTVSALGDFPVAVSISPDGRIAVVSNAGQGEGPTPQQGNQSLQVVDVSENRVVQTLTDHAQGADTFYNEGVVFSPNGQHVYVTGGGNDAVYDYSVTADRLKLATTWHSTRKAGLPQAPELANSYGYSRNLAIAPDGSRVFVTNEQGGTVAAIDTSTGSIAWETQLPGLVPAGPYPAGIAVSPDGSAAYVAAQGNNAVYGLDTTTGAMRSATQVGDHPVAISLSQDGHYAFVANDNDDSLSILDLTGPLPAQVNRISVHLFHGEANGSSPDSIAVDQARKLVYVANAGDDAVAVLGQNINQTPSSWDPSKIGVLGFIPTAWYPSGVAVEPSNGSILVTSAKGYGGVPVTSRSQYDGNDMVGLLSQVNRPDQSVLKADSAKALRGLLFSTPTGTERPADSPIPDTAHAGQSPIKHVVLVVRENRTFDQVFGDLGLLGRTNADADPQYLEFGRTDAKGETVTPNVHDIANRFALSDNFYSDGEASIQGHFWTALGIVPDYVEKSWVDYYSNRNHPYDPADPVSYPQCGSIFDQLALAGKSFKNFGELEGLATSQAPASPAPDAGCSVPGGAGDAGSLANEDASAGNNLTLTTVKDTFRLAEIEKAYAPLVATNQVPDFSYVIMGNDHTGGDGLGQTTPQAQVATNDLAVGGLVDYLSHTPQWSSTAVFVEEDDSQDGLDHRDGHRNILLVASPYVAPGAISHLHVSQASVLRTIGLILGIPPISSYVQTAPVPYDMFSPAPHLGAYTVEQPTYPIDATNPSPVYGTPAAVPVNVSGVDLAGPMLEAQLWWATNPGKPMPEMLIQELASRGGVNPAALKAWASGRPCACQPLLPGLTVAPGFGDPNG